MHVRSVRERSVRVSLLVGVLALASIRCSRPLDLVSVAQDAGTEAGAAQDAATKPADAGPVPTVTCTSDPGVTLLGAKNELSYFDPRTDLVKPYGVITCADAAGSALSLAVDDSGLVHVAYDSGIIIELPPGAVDGCKVWGKVPSLPVAPNGMGFAIANSNSPELFLGVDVDLYRTTPAPFGVWSQTGKLDAGDHVNALLGTGDGRLFAVVGPGAKGSYRVTAVDPDSGAQGATVLVPSSAGSPDTPAGFALYGASLLVFTEKALTRYDFATGVLGAPEIIGTNGTIVAAGSPPCASTL